MARDLAGSARRQLHTLFDVGVTSGLTDGQLLERFATRGGDASELAFAALVERHGPMVLRVCRSIVRDDHEAMDAYQATFLVLVRRGSTLWVRDSLGPWLHRVACRAAGHLRCAASRRRDLEQRLAATVAEHSDAETTKELTAILHEELDRLPERFRVPILLCDLEGRTCEETARHLGCPVGTVGSRLARGRERLRTRLMRLGFAPAAGALAVVLATDASEAAIAFSPSGPRHRLGAHVPIGPATLESSPATVKLAQTISRSLLMAKYRSVAVTTVTAAGILLFASWTYRAIAHAQAPPSKPETERVKQKTVVEKTLPVQIREEQEIAERHKDSRLATIGNMRPLIEDQKGIRFQSRLAVLYKDGKVKLWPFEGKEPTPPVLSHTDPINDMTFFDEATLLVTCSEKSVRIWDALTGKLRKEIDGQLISPLFFSDAAHAKRLVTVDHDGRGVTTWDLATLDSVGTFRPEGSPKLVGAGLTPDGKVLATIGDDHSVTLWDAATHRSFATLKSPARVLARVFVTDPKLYPDRPTLQLDARFWELVQPLLPAPDKEPS